VRRSSRGTARVAISMPFIAHDLQQRLAEQRLEMPQQCMLVAQHQRGVRAEGREDAASSIAM
jgi:DNA primase